MRKNKLARLVRLSFLFSVTSVIILNCCTSPETSIASSNTFLDKYNIMILVTDGVGNCYYVIEEYLEGFGNS